MIQSVCPSLKAVPAAEKKPANWSKSDADLAISRLLDATLERERELNRRAQELSEIEHKYTKSLTGSYLAITTLEANLEAYHLANRKQLGDTVRLACGVIGVSVSSQKSLVPLSAAWTWEKITAKLRRTFKAAYLLPPKPPAIDKVKVKKELTEEQLKKHGLKLESAENFYIDLSRLEDAA